MCRWCPLTLNTEQFAQGLRKAQEQLKAFDANIHERLDMVQKRLAGPVTIAGRYGPADISIEPQQVWRYVNGRLRRTLRGKKVRDGCQRSNADADQNPQDAGKLAGGRSGG